MAFQPKTPISGLFIKNEVVQKLIATGKITCWVKVGAYNYQCTSPEDKNDVFGVILYNHYCGSNGWVIKADIAHTRICNVSEITGNEREQMGGPPASREFFRYLRERVSESLEIDSVITLIQFRDIRGKASTSRNWRTMFKRGAKE